MHLVLPPVLSTLILVLLLFSGDVSEVDAAVGLGFQAELRNLPGWWFGGLGEEQGKEGAGDGEGTEGEAVESNSEVGISPEPEVDKREGQRGPELPIVAPMEPSPPAKEGSDSKEGAGSSGSQLTKGERGGKEREKIESSGSVESKKEVNADEGERVKGTNGFGPLGIALVLLGVVVLVVVFGIFGRRWISGVTTRDSSDREGCEGLLQVGQSGSYRPLGQSA